MKFRRISVLLILGLSLILVSGPVKAIEKAEFINGNHWSHWSSQDKLVYIRGLGNWADFVTEAQTQHKKTFEFCISKVLVDELKTKSLGQIVANVDAYYQENPNKMNTSVIEVVLRRCTNVCPQ